MIYTREFLTSISHFLKRIEKILKEEFWMCDSVCMGKERVILLFVMICSKSSLISKKNDPKWGHWYLKIQIGSLFFLLQCFDFYFYKNANILGRGLTILFTHLYFPVNSGYTIDISSFTLSDDLLRESMIDLGAGKEKNSEAILNKAQNVGGKK